MFSSEFHEILKNTFFTEHLQVVDRVLVPYLVLIYLMMPFLIVDLDKFEFLTSRS